MDQSYSESDVSLSPTQIFDRLQALRRLQLLQRGKLQKQLLQYQETPETSSITEVVSQFSNSTSYNTFRSLLQSDSTDASPRLNTSDVSQKVKQYDLIEGVAVLNLSQESEFIVNSPLSTRSKVSAPSRAESDNCNLSNRSVDSKSLSKKISLDEMPILSPKQNFEALIIEKLKNEMIPKRKSPKKDNILASRNKKPFLKRGEGTARFGLKKNDLVIQSTKALPWRRKGLENKTRQSPIRNINKLNKGNEIQIVITNPDSDTNKNSISPIKPQIVKEKPGTSFEPSRQEKDSNEASIDSSKCEIHSVKNNSTQKVQLAKGKQPLTANKGKTWAAVLSKEQDDLLRQLKQSSYYKNFVSPAKSVQSDISCDENLSQLRHSREIAEQNMFDLLENKVTNESFDLQNSFFNKFFRKNDFEISGESTPLIMQKCLVNNPELMHIVSNIQKKRNENSQSDADTCNSDYTECCSDSCSSVSSCCSCRTVEPATKSTHNTIQNKDTKKKVTINNINSKKPNQEEVNKKSALDQCQDDSATETEMLKANMAEMNAKLVATSELLKDRLRELEDEIETFRKENTNLAKMREEVDLERQKFYEEKNTFEQKYNEEKILSEYYLAEEKEKLNKQKQMYERYVREMRGRLNKKEKDEVLNLKKEISDLKEEIRIKDAKSTSTIARLRNQIKIMEKEKKEASEEVEKLKKENRRIQHSNDVTRRLTNMKYLAEINKKLTNMSSKDTRSEVHVDRDVKYKAFEIERQSRSRKVQPVAKGMRQRAKSVPNLKVTSRYAKYFSQRDAVSQLDKNTSNIDYMGICPSDNEEIEEQVPIDDTESIQENDVSDGEENHLERIYMERFQSSPTSNRSSISNQSTERNSFRENPDSFFIRKSNSNSRESKSPNNIATSPYFNNNSNRSKSPPSIFSHKSSGRKSPQINNIQNTKNCVSDSNSQRSKSPTSILTNRSSSSHKLATVINQEHRDKLSVSPEPSTSQTSMTKTKLNPTEIKKSDGSRELRFPNGNVKYLSADGKYSKFVYYNGDIKENFYNEGRIKYFYAESKTFHTTHADGLEVLEFPDGQVEKRYKDGSSEIRLPNGSVRYFDPKNQHVREEWRFPDGTALTVSADGEQRIVFTNGQVEVHAKDHKRREFPDGTVKLVYTDGTSETRYASGRVRVKDKHGNLIMDSAPG